MGSRLRYGLTSAFLAAVFSCQTWSQVIDYELPESFELLAGQLAVAFGDSVRLDDAIGLVEKLPADSFRVEFFPVLLAARWAAAPQLNFVDSLRAHPNVRAVLTGGGFLGRSPDQAYVRERAPDVVRNPLTGLAVLFEPHTSADEVRRLASLFPAFQVERIDKRPNEILLFFDPSAEEAVLDLLEDSPLVEYLSYIAGS